MMLRTQRMNALFLQRTEIPEDICQKKTGTKPNHRLFSMIWECVFRCNL